MIRQRIKKVYGQLVIVHFVSAFSFSSLQCLDIQGCQFP